MLMCDTGGCEALGAGALTPMQVLGTRREPEGQAMWWDNQVPLMTLVGGLVVVEDGLSRRRTRARPCCMGEPCGGPLLGLRGPMSSWRMLELGEAWRGDHSANRVSLALSDLSDLTAPPPALAAVRMAVRGVQPLRLRGRRGRPRRRRPVAGFGVGFWRKRVGSKRELFFHISQRVLRILRWVLRRAWRAEPVRCLLAR